MVIVDRELLGKESEKEFNHSNIPLGIYLENEFKKNLSEYGDANWLTDASTGKSMTYGQMLTAIRSVASALRKRGLRTGDNVALIGLNQIEFPLMYLGVWRAGGYISCVEMNLSTDRIESTMRDIGTKFILTDQQRSERVLEAAKRLDFVREVFLTEDTVGTGFSSFKELLQDPGDGCPENLDDVDSNSIAYLGSTSGTTGIPKGVVLTQRALVGFAAQLLKNPSGKRLKYLLVNPMTWTSGINRVIAISLNYNSGFFISDFSEDNLLIAISHYKPTEISTFPYHITWLCQCDYLNKYDMSSVDSIFITGTLLNPTCEREIFDKLPYLISLTNSYGMTETLAICRTPPVKFEKHQAGNIKDSAIADRVFGSVGRVLPYCKLKVIDLETGEKLGPNEIGELCLYSPFMMKEYLNRPDETAIFFKNGWAHSGDKGYYDEFENVFVVGRYKELITYRRFKFPPMDVEKYVIMHPAVIDVAVVGLPNEVDEELPLAFVVLSPDSQHVTADELIAFTNERVIDQEKLRGGVRFIDKIPRNSTGKIVRSTLLKLLE